MSNALFQAAKLKPEIRLAQALSEFCGSLAEPLAREFKLLQTTSPPSPADVVRLTEEINRDGSRAHRTWRPYATSMVLFLDKVQTLSRVGDFLLGSAQNIMASGIWAVIKITLGRSQIAIGSLSFFKRISELFLKVGRSSSITKDLVDVYPTSMDLQHLMCEYLITLVSFCQRIVLTLEKPALMQLASPFMLFFDKEAAEFETKLNHLGTAIDRRAMVLLTQRQLGAADTVAKIGRSLTKWGSSEAESRRYLALQHIRLQEKLCSRQSERIAAWRRQRRKGTTQWLFQEDDYLNWKNSPQSSMLWVHGKLGSGKTVLLANMVGELYGTRSPSQPPTFTTGPRGVTDNRIPITAYHFYNDNDPGSNSYEELIGSLFQQILAHLDAESEPVKRISEFFESSISPSLEAEDIATLSESLPRQRPIFIIIDVMDDCQEETVREALWAINYMSEICEVHFCFSTRTDSPISRLVRAIFPVVDYEVTMACAAATHEMKCFVEAELERRRHIRNLDESLAAIIKDVLVEASEGMYLWVALQIETLLPIHSAALLSSSDIPKLLENLPRNLPEAFDRALESIADCRYGSRIFQLVAAARRPLTLDELRIALHVEPGVTNWNPMSVPQDGRAIIALCGGNLLEIDEEDDTVRFIHHSVYRHLANDDGADLGVGSVITGRKPLSFRENDASILMATVCITYLNYGIFDTTVATRCKTFLDAERLTNEITRTASAERGVASKIIAAVKGRRTSGRQGVNIAQLLHRYLKPEADTVDLLKFESYAHQYWLCHTEHFWPGYCQETYPLFLRILDATPDHVKVPWNKNNTNPSTEWAAKNRHFGVLLGSLTISANKEDKDVAYAVSNALYAHLSNVPKLFDQTRDEMLRGLIIFALDKLSSHVEPIPRTSRRFMRGRSRPFQHVQPSTARQRYHTGDRRYDSSDLEKLHPKTTWKDGVMKRRG
ncbi:hypothetical protein BR93DRAFT_759718 [Coniochaeta sp. PMI_546]|nr:hypothetical protein BR93DRAFT_759718 [Coniochaeta sp. PMI_546]